MYFRYTDFNMYVPKSILPLNTFKMVVVVHLIVPTYQRGLTDFSLTVIVSTTISSKLNFLFLFLLTLNNRE